MEEQAGPPFGTTSWQVLLGRERLQERVAGALDSARRGRTSRIWLVGGPGSGKTALCEWTLSTAGDFLALSSCCVEGEASLALATVLTVVRPLRVYVTDLSEAYRAALGPLTGGSRLREAAEPFGLGAAVLELLGRAAEDKPLLVVLDDWHWVDPMSETVLSFALRRLDSDAVCVLYATRRPPVESGVDKSSVMTLEGLGLSEGETLLRRSGPIAPRVANQLITATGGLPLALVELDRQLTEDQRAGLTPLPEPLPVGERLFSAYQRRLAPLSDDARLAAGLCAVAGSGTDAIGPALELLGLDRAALERVEAAGVVDLTGLSPTFAHPLLRAAAAAVLTPAERRKVHQALAECSLDPERRAAHLLQASQGPSIEVAQQLEDAATIIVRQRGTLAAAAIWADSARFTPPGPLRTRRLLRAAGELAGAARLVEAQQCASEVLTGTDDPLLRAEAAVLLTWTAVWADGSAAAVTAVSEAERVAPVSPELAQRLRSIAALSFIATGDLRSAARYLDVSTPPPPDTLPTVETTAPAQLLISIGRVSEAATWLPPRRIRLCMAVAAEAEHDFAVNAGLEVVANSLVWSERFSEAADLLDVAIGTIRRSHRPQNLSFMLGQRAFLFWFDGRWDQATAALEEGRALAADTGEERMRTVLDALLARLAGARGDEARYRHHAERISRPGDGVVAFYQLSAAGLASLTAGKFPDAVATLEELHALALRVSPGPLVGVPFRADLIEALIRAGDPVRAREVLAVHENEADLTGLAWPRATALRCRGMLEDGAGADSVFGAALDCWPHAFEGARTRLCWAESLRRRRQPSRSRSLAAEAVVEFDRLGARPWADRARAELRAGGGLPSPAVAGTLAQLTAQEMQVATIVGQGLNNREAAAQLFISAKTVEHHLSRVYAKLGLRSRSELVRLMVTEAPNR